MGKSTLTTPTKPICFFSHKSDDRKKVILFKDFLLKTTNLSDFKVILTSQEGLSLKMMDPIAKTTLTKASNSTKFIAMLSSKYLSSNFCVAELGIGLSKNFSKEKNFNIGVFLLNDVYHTEVDLIKELVNYLDEVTKQNIVTDLKFTIKDEKTFENDLKKFIEDYEILIEKENVRINKASDDVVSFIEATFRDSHKLSKRPAIIYVYRKIYEKIAMQLSKSTDNLIWSANGSPLDKTEVDETTHLTAYDSDFSNLKSLRIRLVIFRDETEYDNFKKNTSPRKKAFVKSNNKHKSKLLITTRKRIINYYNLNTKTPNIDIDNVDLLNKLNYEFAYAKKYNVIMFSEFNNYETEGEIDTKEHSLVFVNINGEKTNDFISDEINLSMHLNKFIVNNMSSLIADNSRKNRPFEIIKNT